jgi:hypothetical protein
MATTGAAGPDGLNSAQSYSIRMSGSAISERVAKRLAEMDTDRDGTISVSGTVARERFREIISSDCVRIWDVRPLKA